jgi:hypothetical protein
MSLRAALDETRRSTPQRAAPPSDKTATPPSGDEADLMAWVAETCGGRVTRAVQTSGGNRCRSWAIDVDQGDGRTGEVFLRYAPPRPPGVEPYTVRREAQVYRAIARSGIQGAEAPRRASAHPGRPDGPCARDRRVPPPLRSRRETGDRARAHGEHRRSPPHGRDWRRARRGRARSSDRRPCSGRARDLARHVRRDRAARPASRARLRLARLPTCPTRTDLSSWCTATPARAISCSSTAI